MKTFLPSAALPRLAVTRHARFSLIFTLCAACAVVLPGCKKKEQQAEAPAEQPPAEPPPEPTYEFKVKWPVGKRFAQRTEMNQESLITAPGAPQPMKQDLQTSQEMGVSILKERDGGGREIEVEFLAQKTETKFAGKAVPKASFDSKADPKSDAVNPSGPALRKLMGSKITFITDAEGKVKSVEGYQEFIKKLTNAAPYNVRTAIKGILTEDYLKRQGLHVQGLPAKPVKIGDTWPVQQEQPLGAMGAITIDLQFTFKGFETNKERKFAIFEHTGTLGAKEGGATAMKIENGTSAGRVLFDLDLGMVVEQIADQEMTISTSPPQAGGQTITSQLKQRIASQLVEAAEGVAAVFPPITYKPPVSAAKAEAASPEGMQNPGNATPEVMAPPAPRPTSKKKKG
jgi:hypothetical protein